MLMFHGVLENNIKLAYSPKGALVGEFILGINDTHTKKIYYQHCLIISNVKKIAKEAHKGQHVELIGHFDTMFFTDKQGNKSRLNYFLALDFHKINNSPHKHYVFNGTSSILKEN